MRKNVSIQPRLCLDEEPGGQGRTEWIFFPNQGQHQGELQSHSLCLSHQRSSPQPPRPQAAPSAFCFTSSPRFIRRSGLAPQIQRSMQYLSHPTAALGGSVDIGSEYQGDGSPFQSSPAEICMIESPVELSGYKTRGQFMIAHFCWRQGEMDLF